MESRIATKNGTRRNTNLMGSLTWFVSPDEQPGILVGMLRTCVHILVNRLVPVAVRTAPAMASPQ